MTDRLIETIEIKNQRIEGLKDLLRASQTDNRYYRKKVGVAFRVARELMAPDAYEMFVKMVDIAMEAEADAKS